MQGNVYDEIVNLVDRVRHWSLADQQKVLDVLKAMDRQQESAKPLYDVLDFEGALRGYWDEVGGVDEFIRQERASWEK